MFVEVIKREQAHADMDFANKDMWILKQPGALDFLAQLKKGKSSSCCYCAL
jgi:hypothetical protein